MRLLIMATAGCCLAMLFADYAVANFITVLRDPINRGSWAESGVRAPDWPYRTGYGTWGNYFRPQEWRRGYLNFPLYLVRHRTIRITGAEIQLGGPAVGAGVVGAFDVNTPLAQLQRSDLVDPSVYDDLGTGVLYGAASVSPGLSTITIQLNSSALAEIRNSGLDSFTVGLAVLESSIPTTDEVFFPGIGLAFLQMRYAPVPEADTYMLAGIGMLIIAAGCPLRRR